MRSHFLARRYFGIHISLQSIFKDTRETIYHRFDARRRPGLCGSYIEICGFELLQVITGADAFRVDSYLLYYVQTASIRLK